TRFSIQRLSTTSSYATVIVCRRLYAMSPVFSSASNIGSKMPWVSWRYSGPFPYTPQNRPMSEFTHWPPRTGSASASTTLRPSLRASIAADRPAMPAPTTQTSADSSSAGSPAGLVTVLTFSSVSSWGIASPGGYGTAAPYRGSDGWSGGGQIVAAQGGAAGQRLDRPGVDRQPARAVAGGAVRPALPDAALQLRRADEQGAA